MSVELVASAAAGAYLGGLLLLLGFRDWRHRASTGSTGFRIFSQVSSQVARLAAALMLAAVVCGLASPFLVWARVLPALGEFGRLLGLALSGLLIAVVGVSGVLAFSVSARTREFGIRMAIGSTPRHLLLRVLSEGAWIVSIGMATGAAVGYLVAAVASSYFEHVHVSDAFPILGAALVLGAAAVAASLVPAARAARVDVLQALRSE